MPELNLRIEPTEIRKGESAMLTWETRNADGVTITPAIGPVDPTGRIKFFPEETTTYQVRAEGPGGEVTRTVTVEVMVTGNFGTPYVVDEDIRGLPLDDRFNSLVKPVFFDFDSAELTAEARQILDSNAAWLLQPENVALRFVLEGHADERGSEEYNLALGDQRAEAVRFYLINSGIEKSRIATVSLGEERPFDTGTTEEAYALNRRTQFVPVIE
jgi:peptidoglycan-associated lipoprotein